MPVTEALRDVLDDSLTLTLTAIRGIADLHYVSSWPGRQPAHELRPGPDGKYSVAQLFTHRVAFGCIPRPVEDDWRLGYDRPGRHASPAFRNAYRIDLAQRFAIEHSGILKELL